jgi:outer membrane protein TolC
LAFLIAKTVTASPRTLTLTRAEAEQDALRNSEQIKSFAERTHAAQEQTDAQYSLLFPRITFDARYSYLTYIPEIPVFGDSFAFGAHNNYAYGPVLTYTLWDTFAARKAYQGFSALTEARDQERRREALRLLLETRSDYVRVQESLEELRAVRDSLDLARSQNSYITKRTKAGGATQLDRVESERAIISYEIQFAQKQAVLSSAIQDLLARTRDRDVPDLSHPGPAGMENISLEVNFDSLQKTLDEVKDLLIPPPDESHPSIQSQELLARSAELQGASIKAGIFPVIQLRGGVHLQYPNPPVIEQKNQNQIALVASMPLFEMNRTYHLSEEKLREADSARYQEGQIRIDLHRDFGKGQDLLTSLLNQQKLAAQDVVKSSESARMYYDQYKGGIVNLIDVQAADNRALLSKVNKARIDAQIINQVDQLRALSGKEIP